MVAALVALVLLPIEASDAGWLSDVFKSPSKQNPPSKPRKSPTPAASLKPRAKLAVARPAVSKPAVSKPAVSKPDLAQPAGPQCVPAKFRIVLDVGHTAQSEGATSARNVAEFVFNLRLARRLEEKLKAEGFAETKLLVTEGKAKASLARRVAAVNHGPTDLLLSIHHDSVPTSFLENWEYEGKKSRFSDRFSGYSVFVSRTNPDFKKSLSFAELLAKEMKAQGLHYAEQYSQPIMGRHRRPLLNKDTGVYRYDELIVLRKTRMAAVLLEAGSIINRDEELKMVSAERRDLISSGVVAAAREFCEPRWGLLGPL